MKKYLLFTFMLFLAISNAQVGINILEPDSNAILDLNSNEKGLLLPRLTTAQMNAMPNPTNGLTIYNVEDSLVHYYNNECWLKAYQRDCNDCEFVASLSSTSGVIDHISSDSISFDVDILQTNGTSDVAVSYIFIPPNGMTIDIDNAVIDSAGSATFNIAANIFTAPGTYPIVIQISCDQEVLFLTYILEMPPCYEVDVAANTSNVDLQADYSLPGVGTPICVIVDVHNGVDVTSLSSTDPAMTWGALDPGSHVGLRNNGAILARGGDGSSLGNLINLSLASPGDDGGDALELTTKTTFELNGPIFGGGGGGGGIGTELNVSRSFSIPFVGSQTIGVCLAAGAGGGGGSADGLGGGSSGACSGSGVLFYTQTYIEDGTNAGSGRNAVHGDGGLISENIPVSLGASGFSLNITPGINIQGGDGGDFGQQGGDGVGAATLSVGASVPIVGSFNLYNGTFPIVSSLGGAPGNSIKTNSNTTVDLVIPNNYIKGAVQP